MKEICYAHRSLHLNKLTLIKFHSESYELKSFPAPENSTQ